jgi:oligogalacturonide lyase
MRLLRQRLLAIVRVISLTVQVSCLTLAQSAPLSQVIMPPNWVDSDTGHRIVRLTPEAMSMGLYFTDNAFTPDGNQMVYLCEKSIYVLDLHTYKSRQLVTGPVHDIVVAKKHPLVYFMKAHDENLYSVEVNTTQISKVATLPLRASISTLNADETIAAGVYTEEKYKYEPDANLRETAKRADMMEHRLAAKVPMVLFTLNLEAGKVNPVLHSTDWLNHVQFSPTDPSLLMYCHEGLWQKVDRIWTVRTDGTHNQLIHTRTMTDEIAGHEFWDPDGVTIWYDLQVPRGKNFYVASYNTRTEARQWYHIDRDAWSIHFNVASDDSLFAGDGGDYGQVAKSKDGKWIELFVPSIDPLTPETKDASLVRTGAFQAEHLVNMSRHDYVVEPNVRFSPDHKLVIFTSNMLGDLYVFAVEVAKANKSNNLH